MMLKEEWKNILVGKNRNSKYTISHKAIKLEALWESMDKSKASKLEYSIKHCLSKEQKEELIKNNRNLKKYLSEKIECSEYKRKRKI